MVLGAGLCFRPTCQRAVATQTRKMVLGVGFGGDLREDICKQVAYPSEKIVLGLLCARKLRRA